jgi:hypothetical protein
MMIFGRNIEVKYTCISKVEKVEDNEHDENSKVLED